VWSAIASPLPRQAVTCGPVFTGSADIGGADADFILGGLLLDCKATITPRNLGAAEINQLAGYLLLDYDDEFGIRQVGLYLSRSKVTGAADREHQSERQALTYAPAPRPTAPASNRHARTRVRGWGDAGPLGSPGPRLEPLSSGSRGRSLPLDVAFMQVVPCERGQSCGV
jgi:hypothetical protein